MTIKTKRTVTEECSWAISRGEEPDNTNKLVIETNSTCGSVNLSVFEGYPFGQFDYERNSARISLGLEEAEELFEQILVQIRKMKK